MIYYIVAHVCHTNAARIPAATMYVLLLRRIINLKSNEEKRQYSINTCLAWVGSGEL